VEWERRSGARGPCCLRGSLGTEVCRSRSSRARVIQLGAEAFSDRGNINERGVARGLMNKGFTDGLGVPGSSINDAGTRSQSPRGSSVETETATRQRSPIAIRWGRFEATMGIGGREAGKEKVLFPIIQERDIRKMHLHRY
jgi:hypothetical protein